MTQPQEQFDIRSPGNVREEPSMKAAAPISTRRSITARLALGIALAAAPASTAACSGADFTVAEAEDAGSDTTPETSNDSGDNDVTDAQIDTVADSGSDAFVDAPADAPVEAEAGTPGKIKVDPSLPCSKAMTYLAGIDYAHSGANTHTCDAPGFNTTPAPGSFFILWTGGPSSPYTAKLTSVDVPVKITSRCSTFSKALPPDLNDLKTEILDPTPNVWQPDSNDLVHPNYSVTHALPKEDENCANGQTIAFQF